MSVSEPLHTVAQTVTCRSMSQDSSRDARYSGYLMVFAGVLNAGMAVDRIFFHKAIGLRWITAGTALGFLVGGAWMIIKGRPLLVGLDGLAQYRCGSRGKRVATVT